MKKIIKSLIVLMIFTVMIIPLKVNAVNDLSFKGVWISTAYNIDWDKSNAKETYKKDLDLIKSLGLNSVVFQVRPMGDSFYKTNYAPWSKYITGTLGKDPGYDPLAFAIQEAHNRGLKFHAWFNPFRISTDPNFNLTQYIEALPSNSPLKSNPQWIVKQAGNGKVNHWINPGEPEARQYVINVIKEVVRNYNIDGVHIDDYFYPYPVSGVDFPDDEAFSKYASGMSKGDWRRDNVNKFVKELNSAIKSTKAGVEFGISPFGIWKNSTSEGGSGTKGTSSYYDLYCDTVKFINNGWIDYVTPQIYWDFASSNTPYGKLTDWWASKVKGKKTKLYIGHAAYKEFSSSEIENQIIYNRKNSVVKGSCFYSMRDIRANNRNLQTQIKNGFGTAQQQVEEKPQIKPEANVEKPTNLKENDNKPQKDESEMKSEDNKQEVEQEKVNDVEENTEQQDSNDKKEDDVEESELEKQIDTENNVLKWLVLLGIAFLLIIPAWYLEKNK
ncbi:MAG: family 10 glycosylhydrolase [Clostridium sp.]